jgi:RNA polymerase sigma-70 factor, ECF subfamily
VWEPEDVVGEVFLQVTRDAGRFRDDPADSEAVRRWVFTIARHRAIDAARRQRPREVAPVPVAPVGGMGRTIELPDAPDPDLVAALAALSEDQREVVALRFVADLALDDVARITGRRIGAVKALQHRALENLRRAVSPDGASTL